MERSFQRQHLPHQSPSNLQEKGPKPIPASRNAHEAMFGWLYKQSLILKEVSVLMILAKKTTMASTEICWPSTTTRCLWFPCRGKKIPRPRQQKTTTSSNQSELSIDVFDFFFWGGGGVRWNKWYYLMMMIFPPDILNSFPPEPFGYQNIWGGIPPETF